MFIVRTIFLLNQTNAHGGSIIKFRGIGFHPAWVKYSNQTDYSLNLSYRDGFFSYLSVYYHLEAGRMIPQKKNYAQIGLDLMVLFIGFQYGAMCQYPENQLSKIRFGFYSGLSLGMPIHHHIAIFSSAGRNMLIHSRDAWYARVGIYFGKTKVIRCLSK